MSGFSNLSGMAGQIRGSIASDQFDFAGHSESKITDIITGAFSTPLETPTKMISFKFIVGGGKLVRSKYSEEMPKWVNSALRSVGFESDNSAAETLDSQGTFKQQHDTGKNLIYIIVFPRVTWTGEASGGDMKDEASQVDQSSPEYLCTASTLQTFKEIVQVKLPFWRQRKACLKLLQDAHESFLLVEQKMCSGQPLTAQETAMYESNSGQDEEKITFLQYEIKSLVDSGELTKSERDDLLKTLAANAAEAKTAGQSKKAEMIEGRIATLEKSTPIVGRLRLGDEIQKLYFKLFPLIALEEKGRSMSLTIADLQLLSDKDEIEEKIQALQRASRGWFELDADFEERCLFEGQEAKKRYAAAKLTKSGSKGLGSKGQTRKTGTQGVRGPNLYNSMMTGGIGRKGPSYSSSSGGSSHHSRPAKSASLFDAFGDDSD